MELISPVITKRGVSPGTAFGIRKSFFKVYTPSPAGTSCSFSSARHTGCVKSPVPKS